MSVSESVRRKFRRNFLRKRNKGKTTGIRGFGVLGIPKPQNIEKNLVSEPLALSLAFFEVSWQLAIFKVESKTQKVRQQDLTSKLKSEVGTIPSSD